MTTAALAAPGPRGSEQRRPRLRRLQYEPDPAPDGAQLALATVRPAPSVPLPRPQPTLEDGAARRRARQVLQFVLEVLDGRRPAPHLEPYVAPAVLRYVTAAVDRPDLRHDRAGRLCSLRLDLPRTGVAETAAVCRFGGRIRALAARFELDDGGWRCTALRLG
ncbi:Rv3235 family protein [Pseudonocardia hispaniensis]|uniref:Rv3235 family protein n=1 Tax=Pseudonocardia hispaniensis TaxID=904933 RepID=A0ABW1J3R0_9PSEU